MQLPTKTFRYGVVPNGHDILKAIALLAMVIDHIGFYLLPEITWLRVIGRVAFPAFLFLVGYSRHYRFDVWLLAGGGIVLLGAAFTGHPMLPLNILFSILLWRGVLRWLEAHRRHLEDLLMLWVAMLVFLPPTMLLIEYGTLGLMFAVLGWHLREGNDTRAYRLAWLATAAIWIAVQTSDFNFAMAEFALFTVIGVMLVLWMMQFSVREYPLPPHHSTPSPTWLEAVVIVFARNSLLFYVLHVVALQVASYFLYPALHSDIFMLYR